MIRSEHTDITTDNRFSDMYDSARYLNIYARSNRV